MSSDPQPAPKWPANVPLGKKAAIPAAYAPEVLVPLPRSLAREQLGIEAHSFEGWDLWEAPELSWLDAKGKPRVALGEFLVPADSPFLVESKSLKLYLNSLNQERFASEARVRETLLGDLAAATQAEVAVELHGLDHVSDRARGRLAGRCLDELELGEPPAGEEGRRDPRDHLRVLPGDLVEETLTTHLFRSLCPVTAQPDWASLALAYRGAPIDGAGLLRYWISFRTTRAFHETCVERMFADLQAVCAPEWMRLEARFALRGGLAIHPLRKSLAVP